MIGFLFSTEYVRHLSDDDKAKWTLLRAIEWARFPLFATQPVAPFLLIFFPWHDVVLGIVVTTWVWSLVRNAYVSLSLAEAAATLSHTKIFCSFAAGAYLAVKGHYLPAAIATFWPLITMLLTSVTPGAMFGILQERFAAKLIETHGPM